jgi:glycosyltransferase involved in cell wall biosynthesis
LTVALHVVVPGALHQRTGGYLYDARMVAGLQARGLRVEVHEIDGRFPDTDERAASALDAALGAIPDGDRVVVDGLAMGGLPDIVAGHAARLRIVALVHHPLADETGLADDARDRFRALERAALAPVRGVVVTSAFTATRLEEYGVEASRVRAVEPGTDPATAAQGPPAGEPPTLLSVGTVTPRKGHDLLIRALATLRNRQWTCVCAGSLDRDPDFVARVRAEISEAGLERRVHLLGEQSSDQLDATYDAASIFVLPSWYEGYGMALTEALARGLPIISTSGGAIPGTVPPHAGQLVTPGDVEGLSEALRGWLDDPRARDRAADAARDAAGRLPTWPDQVDRFWAAIEELAADV